MIKIAGITKLRIEFKAEKRDMGYFINDTTNSLPVSNDCCEDCMKCNVRLHERSSF